MNKTKPDSVRIMYSYIFYIGLDINISTYVQYYTALSSEIRSVFIGQQSRPHNHIEGKLSKKETVEVVMAEQTTTTKTSSGMRAIYSIVAVLRSACAKPVALNCHAVRCASIV
jgi:hypothetical protein